VDEEAKIIYWNQSRSKSWSCSLYFTMSEPYYGIVSELHDAMQSMFDEDEKLDDEVPMR
jgi:hypothetical protein